MKKLVFLGMAIIAMLSMIPFTPSTVSADGNGADPAIAVQPEYPTEVNGVPVFFVQTAANTVGFAPNEVVLVFIDSKAKEPQEVWEKLNNNQYLEKHPLPEGWRIEIVTRWNVSKEEYAIAHERTNVVRRNSKNFRLLPSSISISPINYPDSRDIDLGNRTWTICANWADPETMPIISQSMQWATPTVGNNQDHFSALLNNAVINWNTHYLIHVGQSFWNANIGGPSNGYAFGVKGQDLYMRYWTGQGVLTPNNPYEFNLYYQNSYWNFLADDLVGPCYLACIPNLPGTRMYQSWDTGVFFENVNTTTNWYVGFPAGITVHDAKDGLTATPNRNWGSVQMCWKGCDGSVNPIGNKISGTLANGGQATWNLANLPICTQ